MPETKKREKLLGHWMQVATQDAESNPEEEEEEERIPEDTTNETNS